MKIFAQNPPPRCCRVKEGRREEAAEAVESIKLPVQRCYMRTTVLQLDGVV